jgi:hypothetical protein
MRLMRTRWIGVAAAAVMSGQVACAAAAPRHEDTSAARIKAIVEKMKTLAPNERAEQRCNAKALGVITREQKGFRPDEIIAYAFADVAIDKDRVVARGAAFRNRGEWYRLSKQSQTADEGLSIVSFSYKMGSRVPKDQWAEHYLVPQ